MIYPLSLELALVLVAVYLIATHALALAKPRECQQWLRALPRSKAMGFVLFTVACAWAFLLVMFIDLGEFTPWRPKVLVFIPVAYFLTLRFVEEFLAARSLGMCVLLVAEPLLEAAFLRPEQSRLALVVLVYVLIGFALFWIGMPYTLRDQIAWVTRSDSRWRVAAFAGLAYGVLLLSVRAAL
jgi:hypothetical protein